MKKIKFRALKDDLSNCNFVYGNLIYHNEVPRIQEDETKMIFTTCLKGTESQFTGLKDKNGKEIYGGDIIVFGQDKTPYEVLWAKARAGFWCCHKKNCREIGINTGEVIGNIHDHTDSGA